MTQAGRLGRCISPRWLVVAVTVVVAATGCGTDDTDIPFVAAEPETVYKMSLEKTEKTFTLSSIYLNRPGQDVRILEVRALTSPNVEYVGAVAVWPGDFAKNALSVGPGFPAPELKEHHPLDEVVPAAETSKPSMADPNKHAPLAIAAGFRILSGDLGAVNGIHVVYSANGRKTQETFRQALIVCVSPRPCRTPEGQDVSTYQNGILEQFGLLPEQS